MICVSMLKGGSHPSKMADSQALTVREEHIHGRPLEFNKALEINSGIFLRMCYPLPKPPFRMLP